MLAATTTLLAALLLPQKEPLVDAETGKPIEVDQRVELELKSGYSLRGIVMIPRAVKEADRAKYDPSVQKHIFLDIKYDVLTVKEGFVSIERHQVVKARGLPPFSEEEMRKILEAKQLALDKLDDQEAQRIAAQGLRHRAWEERRLKALGERAGVGAPRGGGAAPGGSEDAAALSIYEEFPESEGWGPQKYAELSQFLMKTAGGYLDSRKPIYQDPTQPPITWAPADEREARFLDNYKLWVKGQSLAAQPPPKE